MKYIGRGTVPFGDVVIYLQTGSSAGEAFTKQTQTTWDWKNILSFFGEVEHIALHDYDGDGVHEHEAPLSERIPMCTPMVGHAC